MPGYWELIAIISGVCLGLRAVTDDHKIGHPVRKYFIDNYPRIPGWVSDPLIVCCPCMASFWGTIIYWTHQWVYDEPADMMSLLKWGGICLTASFVNQLGWSLAELLRKY